MRKSTEPEKAKIAERVLEVLDCFAATNRALTVTDIVHRYERPQSSTSELLKTLVRMGILYRDPETRTYVPTPRLATLGRCLQPEPIGSGRLFAYMDRLGQAARCGVGLFGMLGTQVQLLHWASALPDPTPKIFCGVSTRLSSSAAGMLLLSALGGDRASKVLWRLHAEATKPAERFDLAEARQTVTQFERSGRGIGPSGFSADTQVAAILLPGFAGDRSLALGTVYLSSDGHDPLAMLATLEMGTGRVRAGGDRRASFRQRGQRGRVKSTPLGTLGTFSESSFLTCQDRRHVQGLPFPPDEAAPQVSIRRAENDYFGARPDRKFIFKLLIYNAFLRTIRLMTVAAQPCLPSHLCTRRRSCRPAHGGNRACCCGDDPTSFVRTLFS